MNEFYKMLTEGKVNDIDGFLSTLVGKMMDELFDKESKGCTKDFLKKTIRSGAFMLGGVLAKKAGELLINRISDACMSTIDFNDYSTYLFTLHLAAKNGKKLYPFLYADSGYSQYFTNEPKKIRCDNDRNKNNIVKKKPYTIKTAPNGFKTLVFEDDCSHLFIKNGKYLIIDNYRRQVHFIYIDFNADSSKCYIIGPYNKELSEILKGENDEYNKWYKATYSKLYGKGKGKTEPKITTIRKNSFVEDSTNDYYPMFNEEIITIKNLNGIIFTEKESMLHKISGWIKAKNINAKYGINTSMGILLYGPHGTGKSTLVQALASYYKAEFYYISPDLTNKKTALDRLYSIKLSNRSSCNGIRSIVFIDEIDRFLNMNNTPENHTPEKENIGSFLNQLLSGSKAINDTLIIGATNSNPEDFPPDLMRKGRFGYVYKMDDIDINLSKGMCEFFDVEYDKVAEWYKQEYNKELPIIPGDLQDVILEYRQENVDCEDEAEDNNTKYSSVDEQKNGRDDCDSIVNIFSGERSPIKFRSFDRERVKK